ncbi:MAG: ABC transporter substrate-binding protein [Halanaeroarchaeum sp.]
MTLELSLSTYVDDITRPLVDGDVQPEGIELHTIVEYPPRRHRRFFRHEEFDVAEVSLASYLSAMEEPERYPFTAIPVFPKKKFRHSFCYVHEDADIDSLADLEGSRVGIQSWQTTAAVWMRGIAAEHHGLDLTTVRWFRRRADDAAMTVPDRFDVRPIPGEQGGDGIESPDDLRDLLFRGDLDAAIDPSVELFHEVMRADEVDLLFDDPMAAEREYFERTGIHPPMHTVAIRDEVLDAHPWVAVSLLDAFRDARDLAFERRQNVSRTASLTWSHLHVHQQRAILGDDAWEYGLSPRTSHELSTFIRYAADQGVAAERYDPADLFFEPTLDR